MPDIPSGMRDLRFAGDVSTPARPEPGNRPPVYPTKHAARGERGLVSAIFFGLPGDPPRGEVIIRTLLENRDGRSH